MSTNHRQPWEWRGYGGRKVGPGPQGDGHRTARFPSAVTSRPPKILRSVAALSKMDKRQWEFVEGKYACECDWCYTIFLSVVEQDRFCSTRCEEYFWQAYGDPQVSSEADEE